MFFSVFKYPDLFINMNKKAIYKQSSLSLAANDLKRIRTHCQENGLCISRWFIKIADAEIKRSKEYEDYSSGLAAWRRD